MGRSGIRDSIMGAMMEEMPSIREIALVFCRRKKHRSMTPPRNIPEPPQMSH